MPDILQSSEEGQLHADNAGWEEMPPEPTWEPHEIGRPYTRGRHRRIRPPLFQRLREYSPLQSNVLRSAAAMGGMAVQLFGPRLATSAAAIGLNVWMVNRLRPSRRSADDDSEDESMWANKETVAQPVAERGDGSFGQHRKPDSLKPERRRLRPLAGVLGGTALIGALAAGVVFSDMRSGDRMPGGPTPAAAASEAPAKPGDTADREQNGSPQAPRAEAKPTVLTVNVRPGDGWFNVFGDKGLDIGVKHWYDLLTLTGPKLQERGLAYFDNAAGEYRVSRPGPLPTDVTELFRAAASDLAAGRDSSVG